MQLGYSSATAQGAADALHLHVEKKVEWLYGMSVLDCHERLFTHG
jgi:hypothetical protein